MKDWKTTIPAAIAAFASFVAFSPDLFPPVLASFGKWVAAGGLLVFGINSAQVRKE